MPPVLLTTVVVLATLLGGRPAAALAQSDAPPHPSFLVGASGEDGRVVGLDSAGRVVASGKGLGKTVALAVCPGSARAVELVEQKRRPVLVVRRLPDLAVVRRLDVDAVDGMTAISCGDPSGRDVFAAAPDRVVRLDADGAWSGLWSGKSFATALAPDGRSAFLATGPPGNVTLQRLGLSGEETREIGVLPGGPSALAVSPDGAKVAAFVPRGTIDQPDRAFVVSASGGPPAVQEAAGAGALRPIVWSTDDRLTLGRRGADDDVSMATYDAALQPLGQWAGWRATETIARDGQLFGLTADGRLIRADPLAGSVTELAHLDGASSMVAVPAPAADVVEALGKEAQSPQSERDTTSATSRGRRGYLSAAVVVGALVVATVVFAARRRRRALPR